MPTYTVSTGDLVAQIQTPNPADAFFLACLALHEHRPARLGQLMHITGGQYRPQDGQDVVVDSELVAQTVGLLPERLSPSWSEPA